MKTPDQELRELLFNEEYALAMRLTWICDGPEQGFIKARVIQDYLTSALEKQRAEIVSRLPEYNSKLSRLYFQPPHKPSNAHKSGYRLAIREVKSIIKGIEVEKCQIINKP